MSIAGKKPIDSSAVAGLMADPKCYIGGKWVEGKGDLVTKRNPTDGEPLASFRTATVEQVDEAIAAAQAVHTSGRWRQTSPVERSRQLYRLVELIENNRESLRDVVVADVGTPVTLAESLQLDGCLANFRWFASAALRGPDGWYEKGLTPDIPDGSPASAGMIVREPIGVVGAIVAYNFPYTMVAWKLAGALAAGCPVVLQPSPRATVSTIALWKLLAELDLPDGTINLVLGEEAVGRRISTSPGVDLVTFTGSVPVGSAIMEQAATSIKKIVLELGGKSPNILLPEVDIDAAMGPTITRLISNAGQRCGATSRILVHEDQLEKFVESAQRYMADVVVGDPRNAQTLVGPLIDRRHLNFVQDHVDRALAHGAHVVAQGDYDESQTEGGYFIRPMLLGGLDNASVFCQEEQFGPVGSVLTYGSVDEAIRIANDSRFGLNANVFGDTAEAISIARRLGAGTVTINGGGRIRADAPWGGFGHSGIGREQGDEGFREFFEPKHIQWLLN